MAFSEPSSTPAGGDREALIAHAVAFADAELGPESVRLLANEELLAQVLWKCRRGRSVEDAVLAIVHAASAGHRALANEFLTHFLQDLARAGSGVLPSGLRRHVDTQDLVHSIVGNLWEDAPDFRYKTRGQFLSYLARRMRWKASGYHRRLTAKSRREDLRRDPLSDSAVADQHAQNPRSIVSSQEDMDRLAYAFTLLPEQESQMLELVALKGKTVPQAAEELGLEREEAHEVLRRARNKARKLICQIP